MTRLVALLALLVLLLPACAGSPISPDVEKASREGFAILGHAETTLAAHPDAATTLAEPLDEVKNARERFRQINRLSLKEGEVQQ